MLKLNIKKHIRTFSNDCQSEELTDDKMKSHSDQCKLLPKVILLMPCKETLNYPNVFWVLSYHIPSKYKILEEYVHHLFFMFSPLFSCV